jgi:hypothetical protein
MAIIERAQPLEDKVGRDRARLATAELGEAAELAQFRCAELARQRWGEAGGAGPRMEAEALIARSCRAA